MQVDPFPVNPCLQAHAYDPLVLMQAAFASHGLESAEHSSMSKEKSISVFFTKSVFLSLFDAHRKHEGKKKEGKRKKEKKHQYLRKNNI